MSNFDDITKQINSSDINSINSIIKAAEQELNLRNSKSQINSPKELNIKEQDKKQQLTNLENTIKAAEQELNLRKQQTDLKNLYDLIILSIDSYGISPRDRLTAISNNIEKLKNQDTLENENIKVSKKSYISQLFQYIISNKLDDVLDIFINKFPSYLSSD